MTLLEIKYQRRIDEGDVRQVARAGGGLVASRDWTGDLAGGAVRVLPAAELLALLETPSLAPSRAA